MNKETMTKFYNLEFLRLLGTIIIVHLHVWRFYDFTPAIREHYFAMEKVAHIIKHLGSSYLWVEFFYILSGFLLIYTLSHKRNPDWVKNSLTRAKRLFWPIAVSFVLMFILSLFGILKFNKYDNFMTLLLLQKSGLMHTPHAGNNPFLWFIGPLFFTNIFYAYIKINFSRKALNLLSALLFFLGYTILVHQGFPAISKVYFNFLPVGLIRGIAGCSAGIVLYNFWEYYRKNMKANSISLTKKLFVTALEIYLLGFIVYYTLLHKISYDNPFLFVIAFMAIIFVFVNKEGYLSGFLDKPLFLKLGRYSFNIYVMQAIVFAVLSWAVNKYTIDNIDFNNTIIFYLYPVILISLSVILGIINYHICEIINRRQQKAM